jgi:hypothetical protein
MELVKEHEPVLLRDVLRGYRSRLDDQCRECLLEECVGACGGTEGVEVDQLRVLGVCGHTRKREEQDIWSQRQ